MAELSILEDRRWANPDEVQKHLEAITARACESGFLSMVTVAELPDGTIYTGSSRTGDRFRIGAAMIMMALELMGIQAKDPT